tara:strand:+ start:240 stop:1709 length:1470 start_codon:yes stop_codon:yes gene_type:complete
VFPSNNNNEITGKFIYDVDIIKNELYIFNDELKLNTYNLHNGLLKSSHDIIAANTDELGNKTWGGLYNWNNLFESFKLNSEVLSGILGNLSLKRISNKFYLFHNGGGLIIEISDKNLIRKDNSFPFMNKFFGDFIYHNNKIFHFGGYGLFRTNNTMLVFDEGNSNQWDEITYENDVPEELKNGLASFFPLKIDSEYYIFGGSSSFNNERFYNKSILKFNFENYNWSNLGEINLDLSNNALIIPAETCYYVFDKKYFYQIQMKKGKLLKFNYKKEFNIQLIGQSRPYNRDDQTFISINSKGETYGVVSMNNYDDKYIHTFRNHNGKFNTSILNKYRLDDIIDVNSLEEIALFRVEQSRNQFFIPLLILLFIIIVNLLYKGLKTDKILMKSKLYTFENDELFFIGTQITVDNNSIEILKILHENEQVTSNEIVAKLVDNGLSYDYASKVKNKIIESLNEKFKFITNSSESFINISKSSQDKRIQILSLLKK